MKVRVPLLCLPHFFKHNRQQKDKTETTADPAALTQNLLLVGIFLVPYKHSTVGIFLVPYKYNKQHNRQQKDKTDNRRPNSRWGFSWSPAKTHWWGFSQSPDHLGGLEPPGDLPEEGWGIPASTPALGSNAASNFSPVGYTLELCNHTDRLDLTE